ncbi:unnamed protein product [Pleuronectes platessa]|uniref:Uncharacterized protein n=1 Tax=Pleuronectes platessa TaxID=8262 RepID=A0A9N7YSP4_PLEPL|nr:unnamed protein product [Pleuronectes platessa]
MIGQRFTDPHVNKCEQQCDELVEKSAMEDSSCHVTDGGSGGHGEERGPESLQPHHGQHTSQESSSLLPSPHRTMPQDAQRGKWSEQMNTDPIHKIVLFY